MLNLGDPPQTSAFKPTFWQSNLLNPARPRSRGWFNIRYFQPRISDSQTVCTWASSDGWVDINLAKWKKCGLLLYQVPVQTIKGFCRKNRVQISNLRPTCSEWGMLLQLGSWKHFPCRFSPFWANSEEWHNNIEDTMGNKQTTFTQEQIDAYQVKTHVSIHSLPPGGFYSLINFQGPVDLVKSTQCTW